MIKTSAIAALAITIVISTVSCRQGPKDKYTDTATTGVVEISADESFAPIIAQQTEVFENIYTMAGIIPVNTSEKEAINLLLKDSVRLAITTRRLSARERQSLEERKFFPKEIKIATDAIALIVNRENTDTLIGLPTLKKILTGEITSWKQINPKSKLSALSLVFDNPNSSAVRFSIDSICAGKPLVGALYAQNDNPSVIDYVGKTPEAIGVIGVSWISRPATVDSTGVSFDGRIRVMAVSAQENATVENSFKPYQAYIALGEYPLCRDVYALLTDPRSGLASGFTSFLTSDRGQRIILRAGLVPATQPIRIVNVRENI